MRQQSHREASRKPAAARARPPGRGVAQPISEVSALRLQRQCACGGGCPRCRSEPAPALLRIGAPDDRFERDAVRVGDQVVRMPDPQAGARALQPRPAHRLSSQRRSASLQDAPQLRSAPEASGDGAAGEAVHTRPGARLSPKLRIGAVDDPLEREADRVADQIMRTPKPAVQRAGCASGGTCDDEVQREATPGPVLPHGGRVDASLVSSLGPGRPLPPAERAFFEPRLGVDLSAVRLHTDSPAGVAARAIDARAYTYGADIFYAAGERPGADQLTAHELAHVIQNTASKGRAVIRRAPGDPASPPPAKIVSSVWGVQGHSVVVVESGGERIAFYQRGLGPRPPGHRPEGHAGPQPGDWAPFDGFQEKGGRGRFVKELYHLGKNPSDPLHGFGDAKNKEISAWLGRFQHPPLPERPWREVQIELQRLGVPVIHPLPTQGGGTPPPAPAHGRTPGGGGTPPPPSKTASPTGPAPPQAVVGQPLAPVAKQGLSAGGTAATPPIHGLAQPPSVPLREGPHEPGASTKTPPVAPPQPQVTPKTTDGGGNREGLAKAIARNASSIRRANQFTQRLRGYLGAWGALQSVLGALALIDSMTKLLAHDTALPAEQREADELSRQSQEAIKEAEEATEDISVFGWFLLTGEAQRNEDAEALFAIDDTLTKMRRSLEKASKQLQGLSDDILRSAHSLEEAKFKQYREISKSQFVSAGVEFTLYVSLERLHGTVLESARNFATASQTLAYWADHLKPLEDKAYHAWWYVAKKRAVEQLQVQESLEAAKQFRSEEPVVETETERQSREFMNRLQDPNTLKLGR